jgi:hypothetical protein
MQRLRSMQMTKYRLGGAAAVVLAGLLFAGCTVYSPTAIAVSEDGQRVTLTILLLPCNNDGVSRRVDVSEIRVSELDKAGSTSHELLRAAPAGSGNQIRIGCSALSNADAFNRFVGFGVSMADSLRG